MKVLENESLKKYTTFRMGGNAKKMYFPENIEELTSLVNNNSNILKYIIGGGSNLIINDKKDFEEVLCLREFNTAIENKREGHFYIGASVRLQKAIKTVNSAGYGGMEFLFSVPGLIGGALYMNAGTGRKTHKYISDFVVSVDVLKDGKICNISKDECKYDYRKSIFQDDLQTLYTSGTVFHAFLGEKLPDQKSLIQEYNPEIRIGVIKESMELALSLLSTSFGYGTKKYTFENNQIQTATQYIGERQDEMQELNKQRQEATDYIEGIVEAVIWFSNTFQGTTWSLDEEICIEFDDSYVEDKASKLDSMRADALSFPDVKEFTIQYVMERLNCTREEAIGYINNVDPDEGDEPED